MRFLCGVIRAKAGIQFVLVAAFAFPANAATLRWSSQGDYLSADPQAQNEGLNNNLNDEIYERLTSRGQDLKLRPALATAWQARSPTVWRYTLRKGVKFHDGSTMTADDVVFSFERAQSASSNFKVFAVPTGKVRKVDDFTIELETPRPMPEAVMQENVNAVRIMSKAWCE